MALVEELRPRLVLDLHAPIELILVRAGAARARRPATESAGLRVVSGREVGSPGAFDEWLLEQGIRIVYEVEHAACRSSASATCPGSSGCWRLATSGSRRESRKASNDGLRSPAAEIRPDCYHRSGSPSS